MFNLNFGLMFDFKFSNSVPIITYDCFYDMYYDGQLVLKDVLVPRSTVPLECLFADTIYSGRSEQYMDTYWLTYEASYFIALHRYDDNFDKLDLSLYTFRNLHFPVAKTLSDYEISNPF